MQISTFAIKVGFAWSNVHISRKELKSSVSIGIEYGSVKELFVSHHMHETYAQNE